MPNDMHAIIELDDLDPAHPGPGSIMGHRSYIQNSIFISNSSFARESWFAWQDGYYDTVIKTGEPCRGFVSIQ